MNEHNAVKGSRNAEEGSKSKSSTSSHSQVHLNSTLSSLDEYQNKAATSEISVPLMVNAGPGSGKTLTITARLLHILKCDPCSNVLLLTFSSSAADEMKKRIVQSMNSTNLPAYIRINTFHSFSFKIIRVHFLLLKYTMQPRLARFKDQTEMMKEVIGSLPSCINFSSAISNPDKKKARAALLKVVKLINEAKTMGDDAEAVQHLSRQGDAVVTAELQLIHAEYQSLMIKRNLIQFADMVPMVLKLLSANVEVLHDVRQFIKYILVDEFQDTNRAQCKIVQMLQSDGKLTVVGDNDQVI